jgi:microsomal epoxide hydrolase
MFAKPQSADYLARITEASLKTPTNTMVLLILNTYVAEDPDRRSLLLKVNRPLLYVQGAARGQGQIVKESLPGARVEIFENARHALFVDEPERFNKVLGEFIAGL